MASSEEKIEIIVSEDTSKRRIDVYLAQYFEDKYSRSLIQKLIKKGAITVNDKNINSHYKVSNKDKINITIPSPKINELQKEDIPLEIVYEDKDIAIINKPAGMVVHPGEDGQNLTGTLANALLNHFGAKGLSNSNGDLRPGIVHRLDKDTSGLLIIAKNNKIHEHLVTLLKGRKIEKHYYALVKGKMEYESGSIDSPISRSVHDRKKMAISKFEDSGRQALTHFNVINYFDLDDKLYTFLDVEIITGRTHQIRVHFKSISHPVLGDEIYGNKKTNKEFSNIGLNRQFLHAYKLKFKLPNKKEIDIKIDLPKVLKDLLSKLHKN